MLSTLLPNPAPRAPAAPAPIRIRLAAALPLVLIALLYLGTSIGPAVYDQNEAQYAGAVREMLNRPADYVASARAQPERGQWYVPTNDGIPRLQKPPLVYWLLMGSMRVFGVNEFAARLPNAGFSLLWFWATFLLGRRLAGPRYGLAAAMILGTMAGTFIFGHLIAPEPFLCAFLTLTFWCFVGACQEPARAGLWMFGAWILMGLGVASKGLHGALYPLAVAGLLAWRHPATRPVWRKLLQPAGPLGVLALLVPWYAAVEMKYPGFLRDQFINEQLGHVFNRRFPPDNNRVPLLVFALEHLVFFLPWTFFVPAAWRLRGSTAGARDFPGRDLLRCWFGVTAVTLLLSSLQDYYLMPAWAPVALWLARPWSDAADPQGRGLPGWMRAGPGWALAGVGLLILLAGVSLTAQGVGDAGAVAAASGDRNTLLATLTGFSASAWHRLLPLIWTAGTAFLAGGAAARWLAASGRWRAVLNVTAVSMVIVLLVAARGLCVLEDYFSLKAVARTINREADPAAMVVCAGEPVDNPSLLFYLNREIYWLRAQVSPEFATRELHIGDGLLLTDEEFAQRWKSARTVFLICEAEEVGPWRDKLGLSAAQSRALSRSGTRVLLVNHGRQ